MVLTRKIYSDYVHKFETYILFHFILYIYILFYFSGQILVFFVALFVHFGALLCSYDLYAVYCAK